MAIGRFADMVARALNLGRNDHLRLWEMRACSWDWMVGASWCSDVLVWSFIGALNVGARKKTRAKR